MWMLGMWLALVAPGAARGAEAPAVKVFILAGQSNMEGKAPNMLLEHQATAPETRDFFAPLRKDDRWIERDDVFIKFLNRHGPLTIGYGSPQRTGAELAFGFAVGDRYREPVLLIKTAWGGHSLRQQFRPPSAGLPDQESLDKELAQRQQQVRNNNEKNMRDAPLPTREEIVAGYGVSYRQMLAEVAATEENLNTLFPALAGHRFDVAGLVWFQGWNDQYGGQDEYAENMKHFIRDVRRDLKRPALPVVIAAMGQNGSKPASGAMLTIQQAQLSMNDVPEFQGNVKAIRTDVLVDEAAEKLYPEWKERFEEWQRTGGDHPYHYLGSAIWFHRIGQAMGEAMLELAPPR
jgi:hypothetical protein